MKIEDHWIDLVAFYIRFQSKKGTQISKLIFLPPAYNTEKVEELIKLKFYDVETVLSVELWEEGLGLR